MSFSHVKNNHVLLSVVTTIQPIIHGADEFWEYVSQNFRESRLISQLQTGSGNLTIDTCIPIISVELSNQLNFKQDKYYEKNVLNEMEEYYLNFQNKKTLN